VEGERVDKCGNVWLYFASWHRCQVSANGW
jgi:hypothetical protein